ncbi:unnamed protein product [Protopolystoma xenopodis]|uniref:Uncharacterized protein n=1 Tax=Protopolystoma xenopodis TaxID=117903 RepID=A0A3S5C2P8_9PLAT|nr:unnamed protein product [Protopolystoma xenopodis]
MSQASTCIAFVDNIRLFGTVAKQRQILDVRNTVTDFPRLLGKMFNDPSAQREMSLTTNIYRELEDGRIGVQVSYFGQDEILTPEQLYAMQLTKLVEITETNLGTKVVDIVINAPSYFTDSERRALMDASRIAGLNCVRIINDTTASMSNLFSNPS